LFCSASLRLFVSQQFFLATVQHPIRRFSGMRELKLRYVLLIALEPQGSVHRVSELVEHLNALGVDLGPLPSKFVSDLLRAERNRGRVDRVAWGKYRLGYVPRTTHYRAKIVAADMTDTKSRKEAEQNNLVPVRVPSYIRVPTYSWAELMGHSSSRNRAEPPRQV
jgi:hypothetical protein